MGPKGCHPAKALWVAGMMGTAMGRREIPLPPLPTSYPMDGSGTGGGGGPNPPDGDDDPSDPGDHESGPESEYYAPAESADACIVVHFLFRRAGYPRWRRGGTGLGQGAFFTLLRLTLLRMPSPLLCGKGYQRSQRSFCLTR